jgi:hypothetical protein
MKLNIAQSPRATDKNLRWPTKPSALSLPFSLPFSLSLAFSLSSPLAHSQLHVHHRRGEHAEAVPEPPPGHPRERAEGVPVPGAVHPGERGGRLLRQAAHLVPPARRPRPPRLLPRPQPPPLHRRPAAAPAPPHPRPHTHMGNCFSTKSQRTTTLPITSIPSSWH